MGLFDKVFGKEALSEAKTLNKQEAFLAVALAASAADGHIAQSEIESIISYVQRMRLFETVTGQQMHNIFDKLIGILKRGGPGALIQAAKDPLPDELRETAFACAVDITLADGVLEEAEKDLLSQIQVELDVPENIAITIIQVMIIKNRG